MSLSAILLGLVNIAIIVAILLLVGAIIVWFMSWMQFPVPWNIQRIYMAIVALIALYLVVALIFGIGHQWRIIGGVDAPFRALAAAAAPGA